MATSGSPTDQCIARDVQALEDFTVELGALLHRLNAIPLFERRPPGKIHKAASRFLEAGRSLLRPPEFQIRPDAAGLVFSEMMDLLNRHLPDKERAIARLGGAFAEGDFLPADFLLDVFSNRAEKALRKTKGLGLDEDLMAFLAVYLIRPFRAHAARFLTEGLGLGRWLRGHCPVCGHWPALAHVDTDGGARTLWCVHCETRWPFGRLRCPHCLNEDQKSLELINTVSEPSFRAQVCAKCRKYLKEIQSAVPVERFSFDAYYLGTHALDLLAKTEGYRPAAPLEVCLEDPRGGGRNARLLEGGAAKTSNGKW